MDADIRGDQISPGLAHKKATCAVDAGGFSLAGLSSHVPLHQRKNAPSLTGGGVPFTRRLYLRGPAKRGAIYSINRAVRTNGLCILCSPIYILVLPRDKLSSPSTHRRCATFSPSLIANVALTSSISIARCRVSKTSSACSNSMATSEAKFSGLSTTCAVDGGGFCTMSCQAV